MIAADKQYRGGGKKGRVSRKAPQVLRDMRLVYDRPNLGNPTLGQKLLQELRRSDPGKFAADLRAEEAAHEARLLAAREAAPPADGRPRCSDPKKLKAVKDYLFGKPFRNRFGKIVFRRDLFGFLVAEVARLPYTEVAKLASIIRDNPAPGWSDGGTGTFMAWQHEVEYLVREIEWLTAPAPGR